MKILRTGDTAIGKDYAGMINDAIGTNYKGYQKCTVDLASPDEHERSDVRAWFVYMDGTVHGYPDNWLWRNYLSADGRTIKERCVNQDKSLLKERQASNGYYPYRLCFQLDPCGTKKNNWGKYVGAFRFSKFLNEDLSEMEYLKVFDESRVMPIANNLVVALNTKDEFLTDAATYKIPIEEMEFSNNVLQLLKMGNIATSGDLLELGIGTTGGIAVEIRKKLYEYFH